jgi:hypothetical protein
MVAVVPMFKALAALIPPEVRIAPVVLEVVSRVEGKKVEALAPVPPKVRRVVAPANAVNEVEAVVIEVVIAGLVIVWTPVKVLAASVLATVNEASGKVTVLAAVGPANVICWPKIGSVLEALGSVTTVDAPAAAGVVIVASPDVEPNNFIFPAVVVFTPNVI